MTLRSRMAAGALALALVFLALAIWGLNPFAQTIDPEAALLAENGVYATEAQRRPDGTYMVAVRTPMPNVKAKMVRWWFTDFLQTSEHYKWWHPADHVWMDWENKKPGEIVGASHLVHEYIGGVMSKLRIQFVDPAELFGYDANDDDTFVLCARVGLLEEPVNVAKMCHIVRDTPPGAEMRSRFWLGHVAKRDGDDTIASIEGVIGNTALSRYFAVNEGMAEALKLHATEEMRFLAQLLPELYAIRR